MVIETATSDEERKNLKIEKTSKYAKHGQWRCWLETTDSLIARADKRTLKTTSSISDSMREIDGYSYHDFPFKQLNAFAAYVQSQPFVQNKIKSPPLPAPPQYGHQSTCGTTYG